MNSLMQDLEFMIKRRIRQLETEHDVKAENERLKSHNIALCIEIDKRKREAEIAKAVKGCLEAGDESENLQAKVERLIAENKHMRKAISERLHISETEGEARKAQIEQLKKNNVGLEQLVRLGPRNILGVIDGIKKEVTEEVRKEVLAEVREKFDAKLEKVCGTNGGIVAFEAIARHEAWSILDELGA